jgi:hypothetical protein
MAMMRGTILCLPPLAVNTDPHLASIARRSLPATAQQALDHGIRPSLSADVETEIPSEFFTQMHTVFTLQRMLLLARQRAGETNLPNLLTVREVLEFATIEGAKYEGEGHAGRSGPEAGAPAGPADP